MESTDQESAAHAVADNNTKYEPVGGSKKVVLMSTVTRIVSLGLWFFTFILLLVALIILATNSKTIDDVSITLNVQKIYAYRYMLSVIVFGMIYSLWRLGFSFYLLLNKAKGYFLIDFYGDKIISYLLATGTAAGFAVTKDLNALFNQEFEDDEVDEFCSKGYASASLVLVAFVCTAILSVMSSYALAANAKPRA
ncbi:CASP-like protein 4D1 [Humulus lupulus]|uniref:CASP-like protein 4D1 n=1 Tax=Humulus lupulus TaxID=3486 RepID=UPI002B4018B9|nr:CASP-like protein 4D1 [Humulus lupulus]